MKKLMLILIIVLFISSLSADWTRRFNIQNCTVTGTDALHFEISAIAGVFTGQLTQNYYAGFWVPITIGLGKELYDWNRTGYFNSEDMLFNFGGTMVGFAINYILFEKKQDRLRQDSINRLEKMIYELEQRRKTFNKNPGRMKSLGDKTFERTNFELINWNK